MTDLLVKFGYVLVLAVAIVWGATLSISSILKAFGIFSFMVLLTIHLIGRNQKRW